MTKKINGYVIINDTVEQNSFPLTERQSPFDSTDYPVYHLLIEGGEIVDIQEQYET